MFSRKRISIHFSYKVRYWIFFGIFCFHLTLICISLSFLNYFSNRGKNIVPVSFNIELGSNFFCTGRTKGNHVVQPLSFTKTIFYLIGVVPGHLTLPKINIETDGGEQLITSNNMGQIFCHP